MKKFVMLFASCVLALAPASAVAQGEVVDHQELAGKLSLFSQPAKRSNSGDVVAGAIIGLIAGAIAAEAMDRRIDQGYYHQEPPRRGGHDYGRGGYDGGRGDYGRGGRGGRGDWGRGGGRRHNPRPQVICYAQSPYGQIFRARGFRAQQAQHEAMNTCFRNSFNCRPLGCEHAGW